MKRLRGLTFRMMRLEIDIYFETNSAMVPLLIRTHAHFEQQAPLQFLNTSRRDRSRNMTIC
jgi:hypothetical protein